MLFLCYQQILSAEPNHPDALHYFGLLAHQVGKSGIAVEMIGKAIALKPDYVKAYSNLLICLNYFPDISQKEIYEKSLRWDEQ